MTRRNDKRNNRRNSQRNNTPELPEFASMLFGALLGKGVDMIAKKMAENAEEETPDIHAEGISNQDVTNINNEKATLSKLRIPADGSAVEYPIPDNLQFFFDEEGKLMVRQKIEGEEKHTPDAAEGEPFTYDDISKELFLKKKNFFVLGKYIESGTAHDENYDDLDNCTSEAQAKRMAAFNKLQNIAKYLNGGWKPNLEDGSKKWYIYKDMLYGVTFNYTTNQGSVYFKNADLADEAIRLMGKESLDDLFSTDW